MKTTWKRRLEVSPFFVSEHFEADVFDGLFENNDISGEKEMKEVKRICPDGIYENYPVGYPANGVEQHIIDMVNSFVTDATDGKARVAEVHNYGNDRYSALVVSTTHLESPMSMYDQLEKAYRYLGLGIEMLFRLGDRRRMPVQMEL